MDFHELPVEVKHDIEDQSLSVLEMVKDDVIVIGGWAVRALVGEAHLRLTWDVDGVVEEDFERVRSRLTGAGMRPLAQDWGIQFHRKYEPGVEIREDEVRETVDRLELRIELSEPRMREIDTHHFFEFDLTQVLMRDIPYHAGSRVPVRVPPLETLAANKLGLPPDAKNNFDIAVLLESADLDRVIDSIRASDDWHEMVLRRMARRKGRIGNPSGWENILADDAGIDLRSLLGKLDYIERALQGEDLTPPAGPGRR